MIRFVSCAVLLLLAGCTANSAPAHVEPGSLAFAKTGTVVLNGADITWTFYVANPGGASSPAGVLEVTLDTNHGTLHDVQSLDVPAMPGGEMPEPFQFQGTYVGPAHYSALARLLVDGHEVATDYVSFERCAGMARC